MHDPSFKRMATVIDRATFSVATLYFLVRSLLNFSIFLFFCVKVGVFGYVSYHNVEVKGDVLANFDLSTPSQASRLGN